MLDKIKYTFKHTAIYSLGNLGAKIMGLLLLPLYTSYLSTEEYGILAILEITSQFAVAVIGLNLSSGMMRWAAQERQLSSRKTIIFTTYTAVIFFILVFNLLVFPFSGNFSLLFFGHENFYQYFQILWLWISFDILNHITTNLLRVKERSFLFIVLFLSKLLVILSLTIYFIVKMELGVKGVILGQLIGNVLFFVGTIPLIFRNIIFKFDFAILKQMSRYSIPLIFSTVSMMVLTMSDRYMIKYFLDYSEVGIYSLGYKIASVINLFLIQSFQMGFVPIAYKMFDKPGAKRYFSKLTTYFVFAMVFLALLLIFYSKEVIMLFAPSNKGYWVAYSVVPLLSLVFILRGLNQIVSLGLHYVKKTKYNARIVLSAAILNIGLNLLLIPFLGIYGAALSTIISTTIMLLLFYIFSQKFYRIKYEKIKILKLLLVGGGLFALSLLTQDLSIWLGMGVKLLLLISFPLILWVIRFYDPIELDRIKGAWLKWRNPGKWISNLSKVKIK